MLSPGDPAPDFPIGEGSLYRLLEQRTAIVFFFPKAFTPGWTLEAGEFRRVHAALHKAGAEVVGVSRDDQATNDRFAKELELPYRLVGDRDGSITSAYQARWPLIGLARRTTYVIGRDRRILVAFSSETDVPSHIRRAAEAIGVGVDSKA